MTWQRWLVTALSLALVLAVALWEAEARIGPGPLHPAHAAKAVLTGSAGCPQCHGEGEGKVVAAGCNGCHRSIGEQLAGSRGLHGSLEPDRAADCGACHGEHHGAALPLLDARSFARAGVPQRDRYDHHHVAGFALSGRHLALACSVCHHGADDAMPPAGGRFLGLDAACTSCHDDAHRGAFGIDCAGCHGQDQPFPAAPLFSHDALPLRGAHARIACTACHIAGTPHAVAAAPAPGAAARRCADCHEDPHGASERPAAALQLGHDGDCARCHEVLGWRPAWPDADRHAATGFVLLGAHKGVACAQCHGDAGRRPRWSGAAPSDGDCASCHASPHGAPFTAAHAPAPRCGGCHLEGDADGFRSGRLDAAQHAASGFGLVPPHDEVACAQCHGRGGRSGLPWSARFPGRTEGDCHLCHRDAHGGQFAALPRYARCTACHAATHFVPPAFDLAAHAATAMPLDGAHAAVACQVCHRELATGVRRFVGTATACGDCHADPHAGRFDAAHLPVRVQGRTGCARCHDTQAFAPLSSFDHEQWTGYALAGAHAALACALCHPRRATPDAAGSRFGSARGRYCADCHADVHAGQFEVDGRTDCARCHQETAFTALRFDHQRDSNFALDGNHRAVPCSRCHVPQPTLRGLVVRYRPLGSRCGDCHRLPDKGAGR